MNKKLYIVKMSKTSKNPSNCIVISKGGSIKEMHIAESEMGRAKYAALCKTPPTYESAFKRHATWSVKKYGLVVELWARTNGRAGQENKYEFPPPVDEKLFFGECAIVSTTTESSLTCSVWKKIHAHLFGGFDDLEKLAVQDDAESDELEHVPNKKKTKHGYLKDGFIIDDSQRTKRSMLSSTKSLSLKMATGVGAFDHDIVECKDNCGDKTIADLVKRGDGYKRKIKDTDCLDDDDDDDDEDYDDDEDDDEDDDDDCDNDEDNDDGDDDDDEDDDEEEPDEDGNNNEEENDEADDDGLGIDNVAADHNGDNARDFVSTLAPPSNAPPTAIVQQTIAASQSKTRSKSSALSSLTSNKKRSGGRVNSEKKRGALELATTNAVFVDDKRAKSTNLDSELEEEPYI